jgi:hypothetical protein
MTTDQSLNSAEIQQWLNFNYTVQQVEENLQAKGLEADAIELYVKEYKKQRSAKLQFNGFICLGVGAFIGFISCLLSILNPFPEFYYAILFGFTALAICIIMAGLYYIFEG